MDSAQFKNHILGLRDRLFRFAESMLKDQEAALDAVQDLHLKLWEKRNQLDAIDNFQAFAYKSMRNLCLDRLRQQKKFIEVPADVMYEDPDPHEEAETKDMVARVKKMIQDLPELQSAIIRMRDVDGMEIKEIAYAMSITENAVSVNLSRARQKIREQILKDQMI